VPPSLLPGSAVSHRERTGTLGIAVSGPKCRTTATASRNTHSLLCLRTGGLQYAIRRVAYHAIRTRHASCFSVRIPRRAFATEHKAVTSAGVKFVRNFVLTGMRSRIALALVPPHANFERFNLFGLHGLGVKLAMYGWR
jgi:hypothetical protein